VTDSFDECHSVEQVKKMEEVDAEKRQAAAAAAADDDDDAHTGNILPFHF